MEYGKFYHIYNRGNNGEILFQEKRNYYYMIRLIEKYLTQYLNMYAYSLLNNHFHFLVEVKHEDTSLVVNAFRTLFSTYTKAINKAYKRTGSLFQDRFKRREINSDIDFWQTYGYITFNPIRHQVVQIIESYPFSSYKDVSLGKSSLICLEKLKLMAGDYENLMVLTREVGQRYYDMQTDFD